MKKHGTIITQRQYLTLRAVKVAQQTIKYLSFGRYKPLWVLHLAGRYTTKNREDNLSETSDSDPYSFSLMYAY